jgi:hypothetical protein
VEKLRKALEKRTTSFVKAELKTQRRVKSIASFFFITRTSTVCGRGIVKVGWATCGGAEHAQQLHYIFSDSVRNDVRIAANHKFPSTGHATGAPRCGKALKVVNRLEYLCNRLGGGSGAVPRDVFGFRVKIA